MAMAAGPERVVQVAETLLLAVLMTEILEVRILATRTREPSGVTARALGLLPTGIVATTDLEVVLMTETLLDLELSDVSELAVGSEDDLDRARAYRDGTCRRRHEWKY